MNGLGLMRRFIPDPNGPGLLRRAEKKPMVELVSVGDCMVCWKPLMVSPGQRIRFHKECREEGRKKFGRATQVIETEAVAYTPAYKKN